MAVLFTQTPQLPAEDNAPADPPVPPAAVEPAPEAVLPTPKPPAAAPAAVSPEAMREAMHTYVRGERRSIIPFGIAGVSSLTASALLLTSGGYIARGAAWTLLSFGALELVAGLFFGLRNERPLLDEDPQAFAEEETKKVTRISKRFQPLLLGLEAAIVAAGGIMAAAGAAQFQGTVQGVGIGLSVSGLAFFLIDWAVLDRADDYLAVLKHFR
jgi:hypothetical protein